MTSKAKNILFITVDEMRGDCAGYAGNPDVRTPNLDALAARGTVFENHYVPFPKCVPSRCAMHTGRYTHTDGIRTVMGPNHIPATDPTLGAFLREEGFETAMFGLNHVWREGDFYGAGERQNQKGAGVLDYTSFTKGPIGELATAPVTYPDPPEPRPGTRHPAVREVEAIGPSGGTVESFNDDNRSAQAQRFLREVRDKSKPFFLQLNISKPHPPYKIMDPWYSMYKPETIQPFPYDSPKNAPLPLTAQRKWRLGEDIPEEVLREIQAIYYGMVSYVDNLIGKVLATLREEGLEDDTLVLFCSDHGDYAGQYGILEKWDASLQDCLLHVPCILAGPGIESGKRVDSLTEGVDFPATFFDYFGFEPPKEWVWHGTSMLPAMRGESRKEAVFADGGHEAAMRARFDKSGWKEMPDGRRVKETAGKQLTYAECPDSMARCKMVRTEEWKLVIRETGGNELYNMKDDPMEMNNLYPDNGYEKVILELQQKLIEWTLRTDPDRPYLEQFGA